MDVDRFYTPTPRPGLMRVLGSVVDQFILPDVARISEVRLGDDDAARLRAALRSPFVLCPNHPEYFTDWMLDKWVLDRFAPRAVSWADPGVVNGMGRTMQRLWLANGLVAAVHGPELDKALAYSAERLVHGDGVLMHPEGEVNWDNETLGTLRAGAVRVAERASEATGRPSHLVPLTWFIRFAEDATPGLQRELDYVSRRLGIATPPVAGPAQRVGALYHSLIEREAEAVGIVLAPRERGFAARFDRGLADALHRLWEAWPDHRPSSVPDAPAAAVRAWRVAARKASDPPKELRRQLEILDKVLRLIPGSVSEPTLTQEQIGERIKRLRLDWLRGTLRDNVTRFVPRAAARRLAFIRVGEPVHVRRDADHTLVLDALRERMVAALRQAHEDGLARFGPPVRYPNPFIAEAGAG